MHPVYTAPGGGTLWLGNMHAASDASLLKQNLISVRMSCLGGSMRRRKGDDWGGVKRSEHIWDMGALDVDGILAGEVLMWGFVARLATRRSLLGEGVQRSPLLRTWCAPQRLRCILLPQIKMPLSGGILTAMPQ